MISTSYSIIALVWTFVIPPVFLSYPGDSGLLLLITRKDPSCRDPGIPLPSWKMWERRFKKLAL
jgi:hypothetical protein